MRYVLPAAAATAIFAAAPAHATQGLLCRPSGGEGPRLSLVLGAGGVAGASLDRNGRWVSTMDGEGPLHLAQAWIDREQVLVDIVDRQGETVAQLRVRFLPPRRGDPQRATGTLTQAGRAIPVRCEED